MNQNKIALILSVIAVVVAASVGILACVLSGQLQDLKKDQFINISQDGYTISKLEFCINHFISPCDDTQIRDYNTSNAQDIFTLKTYQELIEEGIRDYDASRR